MADEYPQRQRFFAMRFCRIMTKACLANSIGPSACWLLSVIAHTEDARHYRGPVSYFNDQLRPLVGMGSVDALDRVRGKAIDAGWLHYTPGRKGQAGLYWVKIPDVWADCDDLPTDESGEFYHRKNAEQNSELLRKNAEETESDSSAKMRTQAGGKPKESAEESRRKVRRKTLCHIIVNSLTLSLGLIRTQKLPKIPSCSCGIFAIRAASRLALSR